MGLSPAEAFRGWAVPHALDIETGEKGGEKGEQSLEVYEKFQSKLEKQLDGH